MLAIRMLRAQEPVGFWAETTCPPLVRGLTKRRYMMKGKKTGRLLRFALLLAISTFLFPDRPMLHSSPVAAGDSITVYTDVAYGPHPEFHLMDVYLPDGAVHSGPYPIFLVFHGGGYVGGSKSGALSDLCTRLADAGIAAVSANYTLQTPPLNSWWPDTILANLQAVSDAKRAIAFLQARAGFANIDLDRFFLGGASAGSAVALNTTVMDLVDPGGQPGLDGIAGTVVLWGSLYDRDGHLVGNQGVNYFQIDDPAVCCIHGTVDLAIPFSASEEIVRQSAESGVYSELHPLAGEGHSPWHRMDDIAAWTIDFIMR